MTLGGKIIDLIRLNLLEDPNEVGGIGKITVMQNHSTILLMRILVKMVDAIRVKKGCPALDAMNFVSFLQ